MADDGVPPDAAAGDRIYTGAHVFAAGAGPRHRHLFTVDGAAECATTTAGDRRLLSVDPAHDAASNAQVLPALAFGQCATLGGKPPLVRPAVTELLRNTPNPVARTTHLRIELARPGRVEVHLMDVAGRRLRTLRLGPLGAGPHIMAWDGRSEDGAPLRSGSYFMRLMVDGVPQGVRRAVLVR